MSEQEPPRERIGKFRCDVDEVLYTIAGEGWANASSGSVESPTGWFARITIEPNELQEIVEAFSEAVDQAGLRGFTSDLIGYWLIIESEQGFVTATEYDSEEDLLADYNQLERIYAIWESGDETGE